MSGKIMEKKAKVLVVEDEKLLRELLESELTRSGYLVQVAANGVEGLARYTEECFSVVLLDVKMPEMSGLETLRKIKEKRPNLQVILLTGHGSQQDRSEGQIFLRQPWWRRRRGRKE